MNAQDRNVGAENFNPVGRRGELVTVNFRQDTLFAVERDDGVYVAVKPICDSLGVDWKSQYQRIKDDPVLSEGMVTVTIPSPGGEQETTCLKLDFVNGWLFKIDARRVKDDNTRQKLLTYQRECYKVLFDALYGKRAPEPDLIDAEDAQESEALKLRHVTECRHTFGAQAAAQLWFKLNLPVVPAMIQEPRQLALWGYSSIRSAGGAA